MDTGGRTCTMHGNATCLHLPKCPEHPEQAEQGSPSMFRTFRMFRFLGKAAPQLAPQVASDAAGTGAIGAIKGNLR